MTPFVLLLKRSGKISARSLTRCFAQQIRVNRGHAVGAVRADDRQIGHANLLRGAFLDKAHALNASFIARKPAANIVQKAAIDFVDDLELPGQHVSNHASGHFSSASGNSV